MKKVLAPIDFSENSNSSLIYAADLCKDRNLELHIVHVLDLDKREFESDSTTLYSMKIEELFNSVVKEITSKYPEITIVHACLSGHVAETIELYIQEHSIDFTIVGKTGMSAIETVLFGSVTKSIIEKIHTPIIVIPKEISYSYSKSGAIGFATDFKYYPEGYNLDAIEFFTNTLEQSFYILNYDISGEPYVSKSAEDKMLEIFRGKTDHISYFYSGSFKDTLDAFAEKNEIKMYIMISKDKSYFQRLIEGHKATSFASVTSYPLMILHKP